jgi:hypothetical protein
MASTRFCGAVEEPFFEGDKAVGVSTLVTARRASTDG